MAPPPGLSLGFNDEVVGVVPVGQQVGGFLVVHAHIEIGEHSWEEVVNLPSDVEDVAHPESHVTQKHVTTHAALKKKKSGQVVIQHKVLKGTNKCFLAVKQQPQ